MINEGLPNKGVKSPGGFSLVELMVSVGIMSVTLLLVLGVFTNVMKASRKAVDLTAGIIVAESVFAKELYGILGDNTVGVDTTTKTVMSGYKEKLFGAKPENFSDNYAFDPTINISGVEHLNNTVFVYRMTADDVKVGNAVRNSAKTNQLKKINVVVWWWKEGEQGGNPPTSEQAKQQGYGVLRTELTRFINQNARY